MAKQLKPVETNFDSTAMEETDSEEESTLKQNPQSESSADSESDEENPQPSHPESSSSEYESDEEAPEPQLTPVSNPQHSHPESSSSESDDDEPEPRLAPAKPSPEANKPAAKTVEKKLELEPQRNTDSISNDSKKVLFQRVWSENDEIVILQGMLDYETENNSSPRADLDAFLDFIRDDLHRVDVNKIKLQDKIRRLKKKFENNKVKKTRKFAKPNEKVCYELSLKIWGDDNNRKVAEVSNEYDNGKKVGKRVGLSSFDMNVEEKLMRMGAELFEGKDGIKGSKEWKKLDREAMELSLKQLDVKRAKMKLVLDSME